MKLYYYRDPHGNFGDDLNGWLWETLLPGVWTDSDLTLCGIGTLLNKAMPASARWVVFGSGAGYGARPASWGAPGWQVLCVRGPLTAQVLGLPKESAVTDGAMLLSLLPECTPVPEQERSGIVFMPHHHSMRTGAWQEVCRRAGIDFVDPRDESRATVQKLRRARLVIADAMHSAIVADYLRVPWVPVSISKGTSSFKWLDWCLSMEVPCQPTVLPYSTLDDRLRDATLPLYGEQGRFEPADVPNALASYDRQQQLAASGLWRLNQRIARKLSKHGCAATTSLAQMLPGAAGRDQARLDQAADALSKLGRSPGFLSSDSVFLQRKEEMKTRLDALAAMAA
ncbi:glycosyltransferase family protein [Xanthobacter wiegelii]|uniref:polysaccharide pyruvyl transferase family protein n=1 Tax=Xanthobacter wiegelii TaxID=3119913 RepID=UPI00372A067D